MHEKWTWFVYILECLNGSYYTGRTADVYERFMQHIFGLGGWYTAKHGVKRLAYFEEYDDSETACLREYQIKKWSRAKKEKLIRGEWKQEW